MKEFWIESISDWLVKTDIELNNKIVKETNKSKTLVYSAGDTKDRSNNIIPKTIAIFVNSTDLYNHKKSHNYDTFRGKYLIFDKTLILLDENFDPWFIPWNSILFIRIY